MPETLIAFDPPKDRISLRLALEKDVVESLNKSIKAHCELYGERTLSFDDAVSKIVNEYVRKTANGPAKPRRKPRPEVS